MQTSAATNSEKATITLALAPCAGVWVDAFPKNETLTMASPVFRTACFRRYGWPLFGDDTNCVDCGRRIDRKGDHCLNCGKYGAFIARHDKVRDVLYRWMLRGDIHAVKEKVGLLENGMRPADIYVHAHRHRRDVAFDVTVPSTCKPTNVMKAAQDTLLVAKDAANEKRNKYLLDIQGKEWLFQPIVVEASGGFDDAMKGLIRFIAHRVAANRRQRWQVVDMQIRQEVSMVVATFGANLVLRRRWRAGT